MEIGRRVFLGGATAVGMVGLSACTGSDDADTSDSSSSSAPVSLDFDDQAWSYDDSNDVYYRIGSTYVTTPAAPDYETLAVFVPGAYLSATANDDGTYAATVNESGAVGDFTATTAPIVFPVNTPGYAAQAALSEYSYDTVADFMTAGLVYVHAGLRGKDSNSDSYTGNAPWGVTDLKSAVRYVRYNSGVLPGDPDSIFVFGHSGGGAQSAVMGSSGDSDLYTPYLESLGAATQDADGATISDAIAGAMCWCPITSLDYANASYEWNMGQFASTGTRESGTWTQAYSQDLATAFAEYQNALALKDDSGTELKLTKTSDGIYLAGSYYDHMVSVVTESLNNFLSDTTFPYTPSTTTMAGMDTGGSGGAPAGGEMPSGGAMPTDGAMPSGGTGEMPSGASGSSDSAESTTYQTVQDYIDSLNADETWVRYDADSNTATVTGLKGFVNSQKSASKDVGAFDGVDRGETENVVMGLGEDGLHFAEISRDVIDAGVDTYSGLSGWSDDYGVNGYTSDFAETDSVGEDIAYRVDMYNPMYFLTDHYDGYGSATLAPHWRIRTGIMQGDTASTTEVNLALALNASDDVKDVDFATVWGQGHTMAERTGDATENFITWVTQTVGS